jgi:hypothetical protein
VKEKVSFRLRRTMPVAPVGATAIASRRSQDLLYEIDNVCFENVYNIAS